MQVLGLADRVSANDFMVQNPNRVIGAVHFDVTSAEAIGYTLQTNSTVRCKPFLSVLPSVTTSSVLLLLSTAVWHLCQEHSLWLAVFNNTHTTYHSVQRRHMPATCFVW